MMNPMQPQQMGGMGGTPELSEEELRKLALLLQQMPANEGLATVTPGEEDQMENVFKSGNPLPGTQGLGPDGGLVQSFQPPGGGDPGMTSGGSSGGPAGSGGSGSSSGSNGGGSYGGLSAGFGGDYGQSGGASTGGHGSHEGAAGPGYTGAQYPEGPGPQGFTTGDSSIIGSGDLPGASGGGQPLADRGQFETRPEVIQARDTAAGRAGDWFAHLEQGGSIGESGGTEAPPPPPPPPKFKDMNGKEWNTQAEADASNAAIKAAMAGIEGQTLTTDSTFQRWLARNKDDPDYAGLTPEQIETSYTTALTKAQEDASAQVPKMVEAMNNFFAKTDADGNKLYGENTTFEEFKESMGDMPINLSEATLRDMYENARVKFQRGEAFTLTPEEVAEFEREAIETAEVDDAIDVTIDEAADATLTDVGDVADVTPTEIEAIASVTDADMDVIFSGGINEAEALLLARIDGTADSPAERQLMRSSEQNLRMLLGVTAGGDADPAKIRQLKNIWADQTQFAIGEAADLRSKESLAAEAQLVELYKGKSTMKLNTKLANMEKEKQTAFKNGDLALAGKLANQQTVLQRVITKASLDVNTKLANLEAAKDQAIEQGKLDLATHIANLQKNLTIATVDAKLAVTQRSMDDAVAMAAYKGQQALYGLEATLDVEEMKSDLTKMGFDLQRDLAEMDNATRIEVARLTGEYNSAIAQDQRDSDKESAIIAALGTVLAGYASTTSDIRAKTNISPGSGEVESFLDALNSYKYEYKDPSGSDEAGMFVGVMAQDLEKTPMGASFVKDTPNGKMVDYGHGLAAILASQASLHDRIRHLEEG